MKLTLSPSRKIILMSLICALLAGCLTTRSQLKSEAAEPEPVAAADSYAIDEIRSELTRLNGRIEDLERSQGAGDNGKEIDATLLLIKQRISDLEQTQIQIIQRLQKLESDLPATNPSLYFTRGKKKFESKDYKEAVEDLTAYLQTSDTKYKESATFMRAECYFNMKEYKKAIVDYAKFPEEFDKSKKVPNALYQIGQSFESLGMKDDAQPFYKELVNKYPKSSLAKKAKKKLPSPKKKNVKKRT